MEELINSMGAWGIPAGIVTAIASVLVILNAIYAIIDKCGKISPAFLNIVKFFKEKREKKKKQEKLLNDTAEYLKEMKEHTSPESIARRDNWMNWVNERAQKYDSAVDELKDLKADVQLAIKMSEDMYIQNCRTAIINFAHKVRNPENIVSEEEYNNIFDVHDDYEAFNRAHSRINGKTDRAMKVIHKAYDRCIKERCFLEDICEDLLRDEDDL